jgi:two-component system response regulator FixJ
MARPLPLNARHGRLELQARLLQLGVRLPVIGVTGQGDVQSAVRAMNASAVDFIEKPYNDDVLLSVTKAALEKTGCPDRDREAEEAAERIGMLSPRERKVLDALLAGGQSFLVELGASHTVKPLRLTATIREQKRRNETDRRRCEVTDLGDCPIFLVVARRFADTGARHH